MAIRKYPLPSRERGNRVEAEGALTDAKGAYLLVITLEKPLLMALPGRPPAMLSPGLYAYCGSAYGPGGLKARVARHLRADKPQRWHVDRLTAVGSVSAVALAPSGRECDLFERVRALPGTDVPVPGFGSSDCRRCTAHLARLPEDFDPSRDTPSAAYWIMNLRSDEKVG